MPKINFENIGDLQDYRWSVGTVKEVDPETDTCTLAVTTTDSEGETSESEISALIFYH